MLRGQAGNRLKKVSRVLQYVGLLYPFPLALMECKFLIIIVLTISTKIGIFGQPVALRPPKLLTAHHAAMTLLQYFSLVPTGGEFCSAELAVEYGEQYSHLSRASGHSLLSGPAHEAHTCLRAHTMPAPYAAAPLSACSLNDTVQLALSPWSGCLRAISKAGQLGRCVSHPRIACLHVYAE